MTKNELIAKWKREEEEPFEGWDFSYLNGRVHEQSPPWRYFDIVRELLPQVDSLLDLGTGGGERLLTLQSLWPPKVAAIEGWYPNFLLAQERLAPHGVNVVEVVSDEIRPLPFLDNSFSLIISRHTAYNIAEVARVLKPQGWFVTQQVDGRWLQDLIHFMGATPPWSDFNLTCALRKLTHESPLQVKKAQEWTGFMTFHDVGALVYYLHAVPWLVDGFSVDTHLDKLQILHKKIEQGDALSFEIKKLMLVAQKEEL